MFKKQSIKRELLGNEQAFTLVESMIAIAIFSIGILAVASMQVSAIQWTSKAGLSTVQKVAAQNKLEELFALPYNDPWLEAAGNPPGLDTANNTHQQTTAQGDTVSWDVIDDDPVANAKYITVTVTGRNRTVRLSSIKSL